MARDSFDAEDFLNLKTAAPQSAAHDLTPIVQPPVYPRRQSAYAAPAMQEARAERPAAAPVASPAAPVVAPVARQPEAPRAPGRPLSAEAAAAGQGHAARPVAPAPVQPAPRSVEPLRAAAPAPQPVEHFIPGFGFQRQGAAAAAYAPAREAGLHATAVAMPAMGGAVHRRAAAAPLRPVAPAEAMPAFDPAYDGAINPAFDDAFAAGIEPGYDAAFAGFVPELDYAYAPSAPTAPDWTRPEAAAPRAAPQPAPAQDWAAAPRRAAPAPRWDEMDASEDPFAEVLPAAEARPLARTAARPQPQPQPQPMPQVAAPQPRPAAPQRAAQRGAALVREPLAVAFHGMEYATQSWNVQGFTLASALPGARGDALLDVTLLIARGVTRLELQVQVAAETDPASRPVRYGFVDLDPGQAEVLRRVVDHALAHQAQALAQLFEETEDAAPQAFAPHPAYAPQAPSRPQAPMMASPILQAKPAKPAKPVADAAVEPKASPAPVAPVQVPAKPRNGFATGLRLALVLAALAGGGTYWNNVSSVASRYGAVTGAAAEVAVPAAGFVTGLTITPGLRVTEGELLATLRPTDIDYSQTATGMRRQALLAEQATLMTSLEGLREQAVQAALGTATGDVQDNARALDAAELRLNVIAAELAAMPVPPGEGDPGTPLVAPCDCRVQTVSYHNGDWVEPGQTLAVLTAGEAPTIHALLLGNEARDLAVGNHALIRLADGTSMGGRVTRVSADPHWEGYAGLDDNVFAAGRFARVEIQPDAPLTAPVGTAAEVTVQSSALWGWLRATVGF